MTLTVQPACLVTDWLKEIAELGLMEQRACHRLITVVATAAVSAHSPLYFVVGVAWLGSEVGSSASSG